MPLIVALPRERRARERRVALVPAAVRRLLKVPGVSVRIEQECGRAAGFHDAHYEGVGVAEDFSSTVANADVVCKVRMPTIQEIEQLPVGCLLISLTRAFLHLPEVQALAARQITTVAMDRVPRTARGRAMDALSSQATVAGYKAALLAAALSPRLLPMMTTAAGTIRPSRVVVIGAGVAGLQAIATARRLGAEVEAYDVRASARERIESLGARMIDTGIEGTDASGHARALRRDEKQHEHDVLAERLARAHAVICAASIPNRPAPCIVTRDMVEGMLPDTLIVDMAATTGGNCELTRAGEDVQHGDTLIVGPLNLASHGAVHASEMFARNVANMFELIVNADGELSLDGGDEILAQAILTHAGDVCDPGTAALLERTARPFGHAPAPVLDEDTESGWVSGAPEPAAAPDQGPGHVPEHVPDTDQDASRSVTDNLSGHGLPGTADADDVETIRDGDAGAAANGRESRAADTAASNASGSSAKATPAGERDAVAKSAGSGARAGSGASTSTSPSVLASPTQGGAAAQSGKPGATAERGKGAMDTRELDTDERVEEAPPDDLTVIDGVGPALQERLYAFGIKHLETIAALDEPGRQRLAVQLELDEEIEDGDWAGQARRLLNDGSRAKGSE